MLLKNKFFIMKKILLLIALSGIMLTSGCSENPEYSALFHTVQGTVIDRYGKPIPGIRAYIGNYRLTANADGQFQFNAIQDPYDMQIAYINSEGKPVGVYYTSLFNEKVILELEEYPLSSSYSANVTVTLPSPANHKVFITDLRNFTFTRNVPGTTISDVIYWVDSVNISAKVMVLIYNDATQQYDNFASKDIVLNNNGNLNVTFTSGDFNFDPPEIPVSGNINNVAGFNIQNTLLSLRFTNGPGIYGDAFINTSSSPATTYNYFLPGNLPVNTEYIIGAVVNEPSSGAVSYNTITYDPKFPNANIQLYLPPQQLEPVNNTTGINYSNYFTFTDGGGDGIYKITLESNAKKFVIYTRATSFRIPNFQYEDQLKIVNNESYTWEIIKLIGINNVDEFVRIRGINQEGTTGVTGSGTFNFTTQQ
jgi:hypothetical protein